VIQGESIEFGAPWGLKNFRLDNGKMRIIDGVLRKNGIRANCGQLVSDLHRVTAEARARGDSDEVVGFVALSAFPRDLLTLFLVGAAVDPITPTQIDDALDASPGLASDCAAAAITLLGRYYERESSALVQRAEAKKKADEATSSPLVSESTST
jgi:hypothetical protein